MQKNNVIVPNKILIGEVRNALDAGKSAMIRVKGHSMRLFLKSERDIVKLVKVSPSDVRINDVILAETAPEIYVLHRVIKREGTKLTLMGDGNIKGTETCTEDRIVGKVTEFYRRGRVKPDSIDGLKWRAYTKIWLIIKPLRRYILGIVRRLNLSI